MFAITYEVEVNKLKKINVKTIIPIVTGLFASMFVFLGLTKYGFWDPLRGPMSGFYPVIIGTVLLLVSLLAIVESFKEEKPDLPAKDWLVPLAVVMILAATYVIGLIASLLVFLVVWIRWVEKFPWKTTILTTILVGGIAVGVFSIWLGVPFPKGLLFEALLG